MNIAFVAMLFLQLDEEESSPVLVDVVPVAHLLVIATHVNTAYR